MRITCPKCEFKGLIDSAPLAFETPVACVRCGTTFEAVLVEGEIQTSLLPDDYENFLAPPTANHADAPAIDSEFDAAEDSASDAEDVLALPQPSEAGYEMAEPAFALEDVLLVSPVDDEPVAQENVLASQTVDTAEESAVVTQAGSVQPLDLSPSTEVEETASEPSFDFGHAHVETAAADYDRHSTGMRLMRISPLWLVICGMTFIAVIVLSNQFAKPAEQEQRVAANLTQPSNKATNQPLAQPSAPASTNPTATSVQDASQTAAPAPVVLEKEAKATEEKAETKPQGESKPVAASSVVPEVETKKSTPAPQAQNGSDGAFTIQLGSYNVIEQANERVARLQSAGFDARVVAVELPKRGTWYRVQAGRFSSREEATRYGNEMKGKGATDNFIVADAQGGK
jgi:cell division septation protein DedD